MDRHLHRCSDFSTLTFCGPGVAVERLCLCLSAASLRAELNHLHATAIEHLKQIHLKENSVAKRELEKAMEHSHKQVTETTPSLFLLFV